MTYVPRTYDEVVRDLLTTLTGGTVRETLVARLYETPPELIETVKKLVPNLQ